MTTNWFSVYTDGAFKDHWGSWAYLIIQNHQLIYEASGRSRPTDSLRMEIHAVLQALDFLRDQNNFLIFTDCRILIENINHLVQWKTCGWVKSNGAPIPHVDLYQELDQKIQNKNIQWKWVRAHSENIYNERCDELCRIARGM